MATRSRAGCAGCLRQHKKCDEDRPSCGRCSRLGTHCEYKRELRWFNGTQLPRAKARPRRASPVQVLPGNAATTQSPETEPASEKSISPQPSDDVPTPAIELEHYECESLPVYPELEEACPATPDSLTEAIAATAWDAIVSTDDDHTTGAWAVAPPQFGFHCVPDSLFDTGMQTMLFQDAGRQMAFSYFMHFVSVTLSARAGVRNGYRQIAAFSLSSPMVLDTIISVATAYMDRRGIVAKSLSLDRQSRALASLRKSVTSLGSSDRPIADTVCLKREVLAAVLLQITIEIANGTAGIRSHVTYAVRLLRELGYEASEPTSAVSIVLIQRLAFIDVLSSVFWQLRPLLSLSFWLFNRTDDVYEDSTPTVQETTGCPLQIVTILARISHLAADVSDGVPRDIIMAAATEIEADLVLYARDNIRPSIPVDDENGHLEAVAHCYYWSACILLQRRIFDDPHTSHRVQHCLDGLIRMLDFLPTGCGPDTQLSLPLYVAALVAVRQDHRAFLKEKNSHLERQYPLETRTILTGAFDAIWATTDSAIGNAATHSSCGQSETADPMKDKQLFIC